MTHVEYLTHILTEYDESNKKNFLKRVNQIYTEDVKINMIREYNKTILTDPYRKEIQRLLIKAVELSLNIPVLLINKNK